MKKENMKIVCLVPMKAHSERLPGKNFKELHGKPLYRWIIDTLISIDRISEIVINTDAEDQLRDDLVIRDHKKIKLRSRKEELRGDYVSMNKILEDDITAIEADIYLMTHVTNPLLTKKTITKAIDEYLTAWEETGVDSLFSVNKYRSRFYWKDGTSVNHNPSELLPTQNLEPLFEENSNLYIFTARSFLETGARIGKRPIMYKTPPLESIDIDTMEDWLLVEKVAPLFS